MNAIPYKKKLYKGKVIKVKEGLERESEYSY